MGGSVDDLIENVTDPLKGIIERNPGRRLIEGLLPGGTSDNGKAPINDIAEQEYLRKKREEEAKRAAEDAAREQELAPLKKALRDEVDFSGKKYALTSKIGGRGLF